MLDFTNMEDSKNQPPKQLKSRESKSRTISVCIERGQVDLR